MLFSLVIMGGEVLVRHQNEPRLINFEMTFKTETMSWPVRHHKSILIHFINTVSVMHTQYAKCHLNPE